MTDYELREVRETFSRLFVLAVNNKMNFDSFTTMLLRSEFLIKVEKNRFDDIFNTPVDKLFYSITGFFAIDNSYGIYNDAYWCGQNYFDLHKRLNKSFAYLFLKLSFKKMMDLYPVYHEMDFSHLVEYFNNIESDRSILRLLCANKKCSLTDVSISTGISINTLKKYSSSDKALYGGSFQIISKLKSYFDAPYSLFVE